LKKYLLVFLFSMIPIFELRGAIPIAAASDVPFGWAYALAVVGNMLPVPFILLLIPVVFAFMRRHHILVGLVDWLERKAKKGADKMNKSAKTDAASDGAIESAGGAIESPGGAIESPGGAIESAGAEDGSAEAPAEGSRKGGTLAFLGLFLFVAIPLPGTGAWTGSLVAAVFGMKKTRAFLAILLGVLTAGVIMTLASYGVVSAFRFFAK